MSFLTSALTRAEKFFTTKLPQAIENESGKTVEDAILTFVKTDVGKLTVDACDYASTLPNISGTAARDAAKARLIADAKAAGKDLEAVGSGLLNLFIEMGYTYLDGVVSELPALITAGLSAAAKS